ncbi:MAG: DUF3067 family protein [Pseudanabaena sp. CRU_2_10]|nr:DUF3067 family protein [Pseudanabaena sp. CRU_2_10]
MTSAQIIDGKALAKRMQAEMADRIPQWQEQFGRAPGLAVLMVGDNPASAAYVKNKELACQRIGMQSFGQHFPTSVTQAELEQEIAQLNQDDRVDGILVQLPLPEHLDAIATYIKGWGATEQITAFIEKTKERPRLGKAVSIPVELGGRASEWMVEQF